MIGIRHFVEQGWADDVDGDCLRAREEDHLCVCQKGVMWLHVVVLRRIVTMRTGVNSAYPMARFLDLLTLMKWPSSLSLAATRSGVPQHHAHDPPLAASAGPASRRRMSCPAPQTLLDIR